MKEKKNNDQMDDTCSYGDALIGQKGLEQGQTKLAGCGVVEVVLVSEEDEPETRKHETPAFRLVFAADHRTENPDESESHRVRSDARKPRRDQDRSDRSTDIRAHDDSRRLA